MYRTIIIEDDPMVASINKQYLKVNKYLQLVESFSNGKDALDYCRSNPVDLAIVDYYMPIMDGVEFIRNCRDEGFQMDFIMITAANHAADIALCMRLGVTDYLVKPFTYDRFQTAVARYLERKEALHSSEALNQEEIDRLLSMNKESNKDSDKESAPAGYTGTTLPGNNGGLLEKGLQRKTLDRITLFLEDHRDEYLSNEEIAKEIGLSRITVRRYVNYLMDNGVLVSDIDYSTGGRPSIKYKCRKK